MKILIKNPAKLYDKPLTPNKIQRSTKSALKLLNHYENMAGLSKSIVMDATDGKDNFKLYIGPARWVESPVLVSMYSFLIRLGYKNLEFSSNKELIAKYKKLVDDKTKSENDIKYLKACYDKLHIVMKNHKKLFSSEIRKNYPKDTSTEAIHNRGGIYSLCCFNLFDDEPARRFKKLCEK